MPNNTFKASSLEKCLEVARRELKSNEIFYEIIDEKAGLLNKVTIKAYNMTDIVSYTEEIINRILEEMGVNYTSIVSQSENSIVFNLQTSANQILIGSNGKTLQALNTIVKTTLKNKIGIHCEILIDINNYEYRKIENLLTIVKKVKQEVIDTGLEVELPNLTSYERKNVHNMLKDDLEVKTESIGNYPNRKLIIKLRDEN